MTSGLVGTCGVCGAVNPLRQRFCGDCGNRLGDPASNGEPSGPSGVAVRSRGHPRKTVITGGVLIIVGFTGAVATYLVIQAQGVTTNTQAFGAPLANWSLDRLGVEGFEVPEGHHGTAPVIIVIFVICSILAVLGSLLLLGGATVALVRARPLTAASDRVRAATSAARPRVERLTRRSSERLRDLRERSATTTHDDVAPQVSSVVKRSRPAVRQARRRGRAYAADLVARTRRVAQPSQGEGLGRGPADDTGSASNHREEDGWM